MPKEVNPHLDAIANVLIESPKTRKKVYALLGLGAFILAGFTTYAGATDLVTPEWVIGLSAVGNLIFGGGFIMATANAPQKTQEVQVVEPAEVPEIAPSALQDAVDGEWRG